MSEITNILLVEDDRHIALALRIRLSAAGYNVRLAENASSALALVDTQVPDVAVIDVNLPDGNGIALMRSFDTIGLTIPIVSIIMSASRRPGLREEALAAGALVFLEKPFSSVALLDAVGMHGDFQQAS